jgi:site-specific DNA recombinase
LRLIAYIRVSQVRGREGDSFISPDVQRSRIEGIAAARGHVVVEWIEDLDQSGGKTDRPGFQRALELVEEGAAEGIAVARLDRFARSTIDTEMSVRRLEAAGGALVCGDIDMDTSTPAGKMMRTFLAAIAEFDLDRIRENWRAATERHIARGAHHGRPPIGYRKQEDGTLEPDENAPLIRDVFRLRCDGESWLGIRRATGDKWGRSTLAGIVGNPTYLGSVRAGEFELADAHEPLVDRATWEAAQSAPMLTERRTRGSLLAGLIVCDACGYRMSVSRDGRRGYPSYGCRKHHASITCPAPAKISVARADDHVIGLFLGWAAFAVEGEARTDAVEAAVSVLELAESELAAYRDSRVIGVLGVDVYADGLRERGERVDVARALVAQERQRSNLRAVGNRDDLRIGWPSLTLDERRRLLAAAIVEVRCSRAHLRGQGSPAVERLRVDWRWSGWAFHDTPDEVGASSPHDL